MALKMKLPSRDKRGKKQEKKAAPRPKLDLAAQFRSADWRNPATMPAAPKFVLYCLVAVAVVFVVWLLLVRDQLATLESKQQEEEKYRAEFVEKTTKVANLEPLLCQ